jgi:iron only hydrogenase large subunit-like protein
MNKELVKILETLKEDFEMLQDGRWDLNYSHSSDIQVSIDNVEKVIEIVTNEQK